MPNAPFDFIIEFETHPDDHVEVRGFGTDIKALSIVETFFALEAIEYRRVYFRLYIHPFTVANWDALIPKLLKFYAVMSQFYPNIAQIKEIRQTRQHFEYRTSMQFDFRLQGNLLYCITPSTTKIDMCGVDHFANEGDMVNVPDPLQQHVVQRLLCWFDVHFLPTYDSFGEGYVIHIKQDNIGALYGDVDGFVKKFMERVAVNFNNFAKERPKRYVPAKISYTFKKL